MAGLVGVPARQRAGRPVPAIHVPSLLIGSLGVDARAGKFTQPAQAWLRARA